MATPASPFKDTLDRLVLRLGRTKILDGQKINSIQLTENMKFPVFLPLYDSKDPDYKEKYIDHHSGEVLSHDDFCELLEKMAQTEENNLISIANQKKEMAEAIDKLKKEICLSLDEARERLTSGILDRRPVIFYIEKLKGGHLNKEDDFLKTTECLIRELRIDPEEIPRTVQRNVEQMKKEMDETRECIKGLSMIDIKKVECIRTSTGEKKVLVERQIQADLDDEETVERILPKISDKLGEKVTMKIDKLEEDMKKMVPKNEIMDIIQCFPLKSFLDKLIIDASEAIPFFITVVSHFIPKPKFKLIYQASIDGYKAADFHSKCDGKMPTIVIIRNDKGKTFGGFSTVPWESSGKNCSDDGARLFSYDLKQVFGQKDNKDKALKFRNSSGPCFGSNDDLEIMDNCNTNGSNRMDTWKTYDYEGRTTEQISGSQNFLVVDYAVFQVENTI